MQNIYAQTYNSMSLMFISLFLSPNFASATR